MSPIFYYSSFLGFTPFHAKYKFLHVTIAIIWTLLDGYLSVRAVIEMWPFKDLVLINWQYLLQSSAFTALFLTRLNILVRFDLWQNLIDLIGSINLAPAQNQPELLRFIIQMLLIQIVAVYKFILALKTDTFWSFWCDFVHTEGAFCAVMLSNQLMQFICEKFKQINEILLTIDRNDRQRLRKCRILYEDVRKIGQIVNKLFGIFYLSITFYFGYKLVYIGSLNLKMYLTGRYGFMEGSHLVGLLLGNTVDGLIPLVIALFGHQATKQARNLQKTCRRLQKNLDQTSERFTEIGDFFDQIERQRIEFTAERFFKLQRSTIVHYLQIVSTYFITFIQFVILLPPE